jgi:hypothetical protein
MDVPPALTTLLRAQDGVVNRRQLRELCLTKPQVETLLRRRSLTPVHPGVYVDHTGLPTYAQRCWAAVLYAEPAALAGCHALPDPPTSPGEPIEVAIDWSRRVATRRGIRITRMRGLDDHVGWNRSPPRMHLEAAAIVAARLEASLADRPRHSRRRLLGALVDDLAAGTHSVLEHGFLDRVLRPHGLPLPTRHRHLCGAGAVRSTATPTSSAWTPTWSSTADTTTAARRRTTTPTATSRTSQAGSWCRG